MMVDITHLSLESDDFQTQDPEGHFDNSIKNPLTQKHFQDCVMVIDTWSGLNERGFITRNDVERLHSVREDFPHLEKFFKRNPVNSFTVEPSRSGYEVSNENFILTIGKAIINAIKATVKWIIDKVTSLWKWFTSATSQSSKIEGLRENVMALQNYLVDVLPALSNGGQARKFADYNKRVMDTERHNLNKTWTALSKDIINKESDYTSTIESLCNVLKTQVPQFVTDCAKFLELLRAAKTEQDIMTSVSVNTLQRGGYDTNEIAKMALSAGYNPNVKRDRHLTEWQAKCQIVLGRYRGLGNDSRVDVSESEFYPTLINFRINEWSKKMKEVEDKLGNSIPDTVKELKKFDEKDLDPSLERFYRVHLLNYLPGLVSTLQGYSDLQEAVILLAKTRDAAVFKLSKAALEIVKSTDRFVTDNFDGLTLTEQALRKRHKGAILAVFK